MVGAQHSARMVRLSSSRSASRNSQRLGIRREVQAVDFAENLGDSWLRKGIAESFAPVSNMLDAIAAPNFGEALLKQGLVVANALYTHIKAES